MKKPLDANAILQLSDKDRKAMFAEMRLMDLVEEISKLPEPDRARIVLYTLKDFPEVVRTPRGLNLIRVCKEVLKNETPYYGMYEKFTAECDRRNAEAQRRRKEGI